MKRQFLFLLVILIFGISCKKDEPTVGKSNLFVKVTRSSNYNLDGVVVFTVPATKTVFTDVFGTATIEDIAVGTYDVYAIYSGSGSGKKSVQITENAGIDVEIEIEYGIFPDFVPQIQVLEPETEMSYYLFPLHDTVSFTIEVVNGTIGNEVIWESDLDGILGNSVIRDDLTSRVDFVGLTTGEHIITLTAKGSAGYDGEKIIYVRNNGPQQLKLFPLEVESFQLKLSWSFYGGDDFTSYSILEKRFQEDGTTMVTTVKSVSSAIDTVAIIPILNDFDCEYYIKVFTSDYGTTSISNQRFFGKKYLGESFDNDCQNILMHKFKDQVFLIYNDKVILYDYTNRIIIASRLISGIKEYFDVKYVGNKAVLYLASDFRVYIIDGDDLSITETINFPNIVTSVCSPSDNLIFATVNHDYSYATIYSYSISQSKMVDSIGSDEISYSYLMRSPADNKIILLNDYYPRYLRYLNYNLNGDITGYGNESVTEHNIYSYTPCRFSPDGSYFIPLSTDSEVFRADDYLTNAGILSNIYRFLDITFSPGSDTIFGLAIGSSTNIFLSYTYPELEVIDEVETEFNYRFSQRKGNDFFSLLGIKSDYYSYDYYFLKYKPQ